MVPSWYVFLAAADGPLTSMSQVLANFAVFLALLWGRFLQRLFFGPLRPMEVEVSNISLKQSTYHLIHFDRDSTIECGFS